LFKTSSTCKCKAEGSECSFPGLLCFDFVCDFILETGNILERKLLKIPIVVFINGMIIL